MSALSFPAAGNLCARPGCHNPATRTRYCSDRCYEKAKAPRECSCGDTFHAHPHDAHAFCKPCRRLRGFARRGARKVPS